MDLQKTILQTLAYWDIFNHPLTKEELWKLLCSEEKINIDYADFLLELEKVSSLSGVVEQSRGFYFLPGREETVDVHQNRVKWWERKMKIAKRGIKKIAKIPFVRAVFVCNTLAMGTADEDSDIDVLIIVRRGRIWLARFFTTLTLSLFGLRRTKKKINNKICLSFYLADNNLNLEKIALKDDLSVVALAKVDIYLIYWLTTLWPVYDPNNLYQSLFNANQWVEKYLVNGLWTTDYGPRTMDAKCFIKNILEKMWAGSYGDLIESQAKSLQLAKMKRNFHSLQNEHETRVVISDQMLKFHENDRREEYREIWQEKCGKISNSPNF